MTDRTKSVDVGQVAVGTQHTFSVAATLTNNMQPNGGVLSGPTATSRTRCSVTELAVTAQSLPNGYVIPLLTGKITPSSSGSFSAEIAFSVLKQNQTVDNWTITVSGSTDAPAEQITVTVYRGNWSKYKYKIGSGAWSAWQTSYTDITLDKGSTLDVDWFSADENLYCYNMVTSSGYPGGGTDTVVANTNHQKYYPANRMEEPVVQYTVKVYRQDYKSFYRYGSEQSGAHTGTYYNYTVDAGSELDIDWAAKDNEDTMSGGYLIKRISYSSCNDMANSYGGTSLGDSITVNGNQNIYPAKTPTATTRYYVNLIFNANGGTGAPDVSSGNSNYTSVSMQIPSTEPERPGYRFLGWAESSSASSPEYVAGGTGTFDYGTYTLYAVWVSTTPQLSGKFFDVQKNELGSSADVGGRTYGSSMTWRMLYTPNRISSATSFDITSSDPSVIAVSFWGTLASDTSYVAVDLLVKKPGKATIRVDYVYNNVTYYNEIELTALPVVRLYRLGWNYFGKYNDTMYGSSYSYKDYDVAYNGSFNATWYKVSGDRTSPYCENMVETDTYPGGGSDSIGNITSDRTFYPAVAMPRTFTITIRTGGGHCNVSCTNSTRHTSSLVISSGSVSVSAYDGDSLTIDAIPDTGYKFDGLTLGTSVISSVQPFSFVMDSSYEAKTFYVDISLQTFSIGVQSNSRSYGTVSQASVQNVPYGSSITANGSSIVINGTTVTATPADFTREYTYEFYEWRVWNQVLPDGASVSVTEATTVYAIFSRRTTTFTPVSPNPWRDRNNTQTIDRAEVAVDGTVTVRVNSSVDLVSVAGRDYTVRVTDASGNTVGNATASAELGTVYYALVTASGVSHGDCYLRFDYRGSSCYYYTMLPLSVIKYWTVSTSCSRGGSITSTDDHVAQGTSKTVTWTASTGYIVYSVRVDGVEKDPTLGSWTFSNVTSAHTVHVLFARNLAVSGSVGTPMDFHEAGVTVSSGAQWSGDTVIGGLTFGFYDDPWNGRTPRISGNPTSGSEGTYVAYVIDETSQAVSSKYTITIAAATSYALRLVSNGGQQDGSATIDMGDTSLANIVPPVKAGHTLNFYRVDDWEMPKIAEADGSLVADLVCQQTRYTDADGRWVYAGAVDLWADWTIQKYVVTFDAQGGVCSEQSREVTFGDTYDEDAPMPIPTKDGMSFYGWFTQPGGEGLQITNSTVVGENSTRTLYAWWVVPTEIEHASGWTFESSSGPVIEQPMLLQKEQTRRVFWTHEDVSQSGSADRWSVDDDEVAGVEGVSASSSVLSADVSGVDIGSARVKAMWYHVASTGDAAYYYYSQLAVKVVPTITFDGNGGTPSVPSMATGADGTLPSMPVATWDSVHTFVGWFTSAVGGDRVDTSTVFQDDATVYAHWAVGYTVVYDANGGGGGPGYEVSQDSAEYHDFTVPDTVPTKDGETFTHWNTEVDGTGRSYDVGDTVRVTAAEPSITLYAQYAEETYEFILQYSAPGATGVPQSQEYEGSSPTYSATVSDAVPAKSELTFSGWSETEGSSWPDYLPGSRITLREGTTTLYAVWESGTGGATAAVDNVRIFKSVGGPYIDVSGRLAVRSRIHEVENFGATASFTIVNDYSDNLLASSFMGWSDHSSGALATGMFVQIRDGDETGYCWGTFMITTLDASDDLITVTCGDYIQVLRATGAEYYRNHYNPSGNRMMRAICRPTSPDTAIVMDRPEGVLFSGDINVGDVKYMVSEEQAYTVGSTDTHGNYHVTSVIYLGGTGSAYRSIGIVGLEYLKVYLKGHASSGGVDTVYYTISLYGGPSIGGDLIEEWEESTSRTSDYEEITLNLTDPVDLSAYSYITIRVTGYQTYGGSLTRIPMVYTMRATALDCTTSVDSTDYSGSSLYCVLGAFIYENCGGTNGTDVEGPYFKITSIHNATPSSALITPGFERAWATYTDPSSNVNLVDVATAILEAPGATLVSVNCAREINMFRCGGDDYHAYLAALADMEDEGGTYEGRQHAFCASPGQWAVVNLGLRYRAEDTGQKTFYYGGDTAPNASAQVAKSFNPSISKAGRPILAMSKGTANDGTPIMVAIRDPDVEIGSSVVTLSSSDTSAKDSAFAAYSKIMTNRSTQWEGEMELSGIYDAFMKRSGRWIGGVPVRIRDSRYGMSNYKAKVKECTIDYQSLITTLVLNNYSENYSNELIDTSAMAFQAGNRASVATAAELYTRQYVFVETSQALPSGSAYQVEYYMDGAWAATVDAEIIKYPELGICTVVGYFPIGNDFSTNQYPITKLRLVVDSVAGSDIPIPEAVRPDKNQLQYVIVNIQMTLN